MTPARSGAAQTTAATPALRVLLADDDVLVRQGLRVLLEAHPDLTVVGEAADGTEALERAAALRPDVVVMDVRMPVTDGITATRAIVAWEQPRPRVLVLTTFDLDEIVFDALEAGADGFLLKRSTPEQLIDGIRTVAAGDALIAPAVTRRFLAEVSRRRAGPPGANGLPLVSSLTDREAEVLRCLADGLSNAEIAARLVIGHETVKTHIKRICMKTATRDRTQAVVWAYRTGFVAPTA
jgi:DNA-binding NarL/FixJ family response regulator